MKIDINRIKFHNIREFKDLEFTFGDSEVNHISTIQMANGTGKTTTLNLLRTVYSRYEPTPEEVFNYKPTRYDADSGTFTVVLTIDGEHYTIELNFDYESGICEYYTTVPNSGRTLGYKIPQKYSFSPEFVELFIFNGELAESLLKNGNNAAARAIDQLYGTSHIKILSKDVEEYKINEISKIDTNLKKEKGIKQRTGRLKTMMRTKATLEKDLVSLNSEKEYKTALKEDIETELDKLLDDKAKNELYSIKENIESEKLKLNDAINQLQNNSTSVACFCPSLFKQLTRLKDQMDVLKLPRGTSSDFFEEVCNSEVCICGCRLTDKTKAVIRENSKKYLSDDYYGIMNSVKTSINNFSIVDRNFEDYRDEVEDHVLKIHDLQQDYDRIYTQIGGQEAEKKVHELTKQLKTYDEDLNNINMDIVLLTDPYLNPDPNTNISVCEKEIEKIKDEIGRGTELIKIQTKSELLIKILNDISSLSMDKLKSRIISETNEMVKEILNNEVVIDSIDDHIVLKGKSNASEGQKLTLGYVYLSSLFKDSEYRLPFIIDSPCGSLDLHNRVKIAQIVPGLFHQVVFLITSSERHMFTDVMMRREDIHPCTVWKTEDDSIISKSDDLNLFLKYQSDEE